MAGHPYVTFTASHGANEPHTAGTWQYDADSHWQICPDCGVSSNEAAHNWDAGRITKQPNCKEAGKKVYTCQTCGGTKEESIPKTTDHSYDYSCDEQCNVCGANRTVNHTFGTQWQSNNGSHWHSCTVCGKKADEAAHEWQNDVCLDCGVKKSEQNATDPVEDETDPAVNETDPEIDVTDPAVDATDPAVDATDPAVDATDPVVDGTDPAVDHKFLSK